MKYEKLLPVIKIKRWLVFLLLTYEHIFDIITDIERTFYIYKVIHCIGSTWIFHSDVK